MSSTELVRSRVLTTTETDEERMAFTGAFGKVVGKTVYSTLLGLVSAVNDAYNEVQSTKLTVDAQRLYWMPSSVVRVAMLASKEDGKLYEVLGKYTAGYLARTMVGLEQGVNMVLNLTNGYSLPFDEKAWEGLLQNLSCLCLGLNSVETGEGRPSVAVGTLNATLRSLCTRLCNLVEFTVARAYTELESAELLLDKYVSKDTPSLEQVYGIPSALLKYCTTSGMSEPEEVETGTEAESNAFEEREVMSVEDFEELECSEDTEEVEPVKEVEEPEEAEPEEVEEANPEELMQGLEGDDGRLLRIPTDEECAQLLQEMEVEAEEAAEGEGEVYFDVWAFSGDDEDEIPVRNPLTPPLPPMVFGNVKDGYLPTRVFNAFKE